MSNKVAKAYWELRDDCVRRISDAVISEGLKGIAPQLNVIFSLYDEWRKLADKEKL
jgi:hypothetical protein